MTDRPVAGQLGWTAGLAERAAGGVPQAFHQRGQVHKMRNILTKLPQAARALLMPLFCQVFTAASYEHGLKRGRALIARWRARYPAAMACLEQDLEACLVYLKFPKEHDQSLRTTNLLERTFGKGRRRTKVILAVSLGDCLSQAGVCDVAHGVTTLARVAGDAAHPV